ncbi:MAG: hypothetical protein ACRDSE_11570 [Pseudonocardiaceae bacterium]
MGSPTPRPEPDGGAQFVHDMVSADPSTGATTGPTTGTAALRDLMLPGADAYMRDIEARVAAKNGGRGPANLRFNRAGVAKAIEDVNELRRRLRDAVHEARLLASITRRDDEISDHYAGVANEAGKEYRRYLTKTQEDLMNFIEDLEIIRDRYAAQDDDIASDFDRTDS